MSCARAADRAGGLGQADDLADGARYRGEGLLPLVSEARAAFRTQLAEVVGEEPGRHFLQSPCDRRDLDHHIGALAASLDHLLQAADLALGLAEPGRVVVPPRGVTRAASAGSAMSPSGT